MCLDVFLNDTFRRGRELDALRLLTESHLDRRTGKIETQAHPCDDGGNEEETETDNQHMFHVRRTHLAGRCVQGFLLYIRAAQ
jgi:hypothetical protein